jgi:glutamate racemase
LKTGIGVFDSGIGGLSVVREILRALPQEHILYFADTARVPYGERRLDEIRSFALAITQFLVEQGAKAIVMACNMSSAVALDSARARWSEIPIIGVIEPGARAAVRASRGRAIGVLATTGTVKSGAYVRAIGEIDSNIRVVQQACPRFVPLVEAGLAESEEAEAAARDYVTPLIRAGCKTLVLGCTHYPFLRRAIESAAGPGTIVVDPAAETAQVLAEELTSRGMVGESSGNSHRFFASGETTSLEELGSRFLGMPITNIENVDPVIENAGLLHTDHTLRS